MLTHLHIRHFAIIDNTELELSAGMSALTGETGAGKSILLDALGLVLGARASSDSVQQGAKRAEVTATFSLQHLPDVTHWLQSHDLDEDNDCLLRRVLTTTGKSRATINGRPVTAQLLRELGEMLISIHGQHAHQTLANAAQQRKLLDQFSNHPLHQTVVQAFDNWQQADQHYCQQLKLAQTREQRRDLLQFQLQEFDTLDIAGNSIADIESEHHWQANAERLIELGNQVLSKLDDEQGATHALVTAQRPLQELITIDERLRETLDLVDSASIQTAEAASLLRSHLSSLSHDQNRLAWLDERLAIAHRLAQKHQVTANELTDVEQKLTCELEQLTTAESRPQFLADERDAKLQGYRAQACKLSRLRKKSARLLASAISDSMQTLGMIGGEFVVTVNTDTDSLHAHGQDTVAFLVKSNPGVAAAALSKVASVGEL